MLLRPGLRVLDAGCGPGTIARRLLTQEPRIDLTLLDKDPQMLAKCHDIPGHHLQGRIESLPLRGGSVDIALAFWTLETLANPSAGLRELVRVTRPGGWIALAFCAQDGTVDWLDRCIRLGIAARGSGRMLARARVRRDLAQAGVADIRQLHCRGPARALIARKPDLRASSAQDKAKPTHLQHRARQLSERMTVS